MNVNNDNIAVEKVKFPFTPGLDLLEKLREQIPLGRFRFLDMRAADDSGRRYVFIGERLNGQRRHCFVQ